MNTCRKKWAYMGRKLGHPPEGGEFSILVTKWSMEAIIWVGTRTQVFFSPVMKKKKNPPKFYTLKKSPAWKGIGSSQVIVLMPYSKKQIWIWTEETGNWINLYQKPAIPLQSRECRSLTPVSGLHLETQVFAVDQSPPTTPITIFHTAALPPKELLSPQFKWSTSAQ